MKSEEQEKLLLDLQPLAQFQAQLKLEEDQIQALFAKFLTIDPKSDVKVEYARVRGGLEALKNLRAIRERLQENHRSRLRNS